MSNVKRVVTNVPSHLAVILQRLNAEKQNVSSDVF